MQSGRMITIALIAGFVGSGLVWFTWSLLENVFAGRAKKKGTSTEEAPASSEGASDADKPAART